MVGRRKAESSLEKCQRAKFLNVSSTAKVWCSLPSEKGCIISTCLCLVLFSSIQAELFIPPVKMGEWSPCGSRTRLGYQQRQSQLRTALEYKHDTQLLPFSPNATQILSENPQFSLSTPSLLTPNRGNVSLVSYLNSTC